MNTENCQVHLRINEQSKRKLDIRAHQQNNWEELKQDSFHRHQSGNCEEIVYRGCKDLKRQAEILDTSSGLYSIIFSQVLYTSLFSRPFLTYKRWSGHDTNVYVTVGFSIIDSVFCTVALLHIDSTRAVQERSDNRSRPRYLKHSTHSRWWPCK